jgi:microbial collagenase
LHPTVLAIGLYTITLGASAAASAADADLPLRAHHAAPALHQAPMPHTRTVLPPSDEQTRYNLPPTRKPRYDLVPPNRMVAARAQAASSCSDVNQFANYSGSALADYVASLPDYECTYALFSLPASQAAVIYAPANLSAIATRFTQEAAAYNGSGMALVNLALYLRAGYYLDSGGTVTMPDSLTQSLRAPLKQVIESSRLYVSNASASSTAGETIRLITNMHDEAWFLPSMKTVFQRFTNTAANPNAAAALQQSSAAGALTSALTVLFYAHSRADALTTIQNDTSYPTALNNLLVYDKAALIGTGADYELTDTANEAFRFLQYPAQQATVRPMVQAAINSSSMTGADSGIWLAGASAVSYYDAANCAQYGTCNYQAKLADAVLKYSYTCSPTLRIRAQDMTTEQFQGACSTLQTEEAYFHTMLQTQNKPVANDHNTSLELVVFDDYTNYQKYAGAIYGISTDNGGMYLEGDPSSSTNQARFVAHEASWLRPEFQIWNLQHEYVHYLDGRFDMLGDFSAATTEPTVWWIEGIAEYLSLKNNNQAAITAARTGQYRLSDIFGNTYGMNDYVNRAYRWGYMATRFMVERHRPDVDAAVARFRVGDYTGYQSYMNAIGTRYDGEFATWANAAGTTGEPPLPSTLDNLPACSSTSQLGKNCAIRNLSGSSQAYLYLMLPAGASNVTIRTAGGTGDVDMYVALDRYPTTTSYDYASSATGNAESVTLPAPTSGHWYYVVLKARQPFANVSAAASW